MAERKARRKLGRPSLPLGEKKLAPLGFRPTPGMRESLERAAQENGRSVSKEIESRLEASFVDEDSRDREYGGKAMRALLRILGNVADIIETRTGKSWDKDGDTYTRVKAAWDEIIRSWGPALPASELKMYQEEFQEDEELDREREELREAMPQPFVYPPPTQGLLGTYTSEEEKEIAGAKAENDREFAEWNKKNQALSLRADKRYEILKARVEHTQALRDEGKEVASLFPPV